MALIGKNYVNPDSVLARTAWEMVQTHAGGLGPHAGMTVCPVCGEPLPCAAGRSAAEVVAAAGLAESSGLIDAAREGRGGPNLDPASPLGPPSPAAGLSPAAEPLPEPAYLAGPQAVAPPSFDVPREPPRMTQQPGEDRPGIIPPGPAPTSPAASGMPAFGPAPTSPAASGMPAFGPVPSGSGALSSPPYGLTPPGPDAFGPASPVKPSFAYPSSDQPPSVAPSFGDPSPGQLAAGDAEAARHPLDRGTDPSGPSDLSAARPEAVHPDPNAVPQRPQVAPDTDPLLLGPPLFAQQNRPLDAPRFTPSARVPEAAVPQQNTPSPNGTAFQQPIPDPAQRPESAHQPGGVAQPNQTDRPAPAPQAGEASQSGVDDQFARPAQTNRPAPTQNPPSAPDNPRPAGPASGLPEGFGQHGAPTELGQQGGWAAGPVQQSNLAAALNQQGDQFAGHDGPPSPGPQPRQSARPPLEPPQMGQLNRQLDVAPQLPPAAPQGHAGQRPSGIPFPPAPMTPHHSSPPEAGAPPAAYPPQRPTRPPLEPPQMGQLNRPLPAADAADSPSGLPARTGALQPPASWPPAQAPAAQAAEATPGVARPEDTPSGLPPRPQPQPAWADPNAEQERGHHNG